MKPLIIIIFCVSFFSCENEQKKDLKAINRIDFYENYKRDFMLKDKKIAFDRDIILNEDELRLDEYLKSLRRTLKKEIQLTNPRFYNEPFHKIKRFIEASPLFNMFSAMPKGGLLHTHSGGVTNIAWVIKRAKALPNCYVYTNKKDTHTLYGQLRIYKEDSIPSGYMLLKDKIESEPAFEQELYNLLILDNSTLKATEDYWLEFEKRFMRIMPLLSYRPFFKIYYKKAFLDLIEDKISHVEIRFIFGNLYDETNTSFPIDTMVDDLKDVVTDIQKAHPEFSLNLIYTSFKFLGVEEINHQLEEAFRLKKKYPKLITGFDLVAEEDRGNPIDFYRESWKKHSALEKATGLKLPLFLHAGESHSIKNKNLYDAILLQSKRIGHGLNLVLSPSLMEEAKKNNILIEVNPLSNQILGYVSDLRNHPARIFLKNGIPCSLSSDDPGVFGYEGLSYDFFMVFMAWELDLKAIKKLVFNSIEYSTLQDKDKQEKLETLKQSWDAFVIKTNATLKP